TCLSATVPAGKLQPGKTYLWAVEAKNGVASSGFSRESSFSTELLHKTIALMPGPFANRAPGKPVVIGPANGALALWPVTLRWRDGGDDNKPNLFRNYEWKVTDTVTGQIVWNRTWENAAGGAASCQPLANRASSWTCFGAMVPDKALVPGRVYSWSVEASDGALSSGFTVPWTFTAPALPANVAPNKPALLTPVPNATVSLPLRLTWTDGGDNDNKPNTARNYQWYITDSATGQIVWNRTWNNADGGTASCPLVAGQTTWKCTYATVPDGKLVPGKTYTWAVAANDGSRFSGYTAVSTFTVSPNQNLLSEKASFAAPLNDSNPHTYDIAYAPATGVMTVKRDGAVMGTFTDPQPLAQGGFVMAMSNLTKVGFDNLTVTANQPANAPPVRSVYYSHSDHLGSSSVVTDSGGNIAQQLDYLPYGEERINAQTPAAGAAAFNTKKKYTGKELDSETGLYYYGARYYDSRISRFISLDPAGINLSDIRSFTNPQGWNMYSYALNNPVRYTDPTGKFWEELGNYMKFGVYANNEQVANYESTAIKLEQNPNNAQLVSPQTQDYLSQRTFDKKMSELNSCLLCSNESTIDPGKSDTGNLSDEELIANRQAIGNNGQAGMMPMMGTTGGVTKISKTDAIINKIEKWLGEKTIVKTNKAGDKVFMNADGTKKMRFDINNPKPHMNPHAHVEEVNGKSGPIYPKDVEKK
ncbi:MAG: RHS repeat-associated core domain-containing protein, partial [Candidatus Gracilibacteria bacterium]